MRRKKSQPIRNKLDLTDKTQVRLLKKRLRLSESELTRIIDKTGNSIAAIAACCPCLIGSVFTVVNAGLQ